ncbi:MAG: PAS domain S-box protein, partial [Immundisolibacteraceae bacterium]|nr:PAS domain S-box protein [Immundisolibacteraceae bacterium]
LPLVLKAIEQAGNSDAPLQIEFRVIEVDGDVRNIVLYGETETDADGTFMSATGVFRDITEQKHTESRYIELGKLLEGSRTGLVIARVSDLCVLFVNQKYCSDSGFSVEEVVGNSCADIISDWNPEQIEQLFTSVASNEMDSENWSFQTAHMVKKDGTSYPSDAWIQTTEWEGEKVVAAMLADITDRIDSQQALERSEEKYRQLFDALPDGVLLFKQPDMTIIDCNQELATSHGWSLDELRGQSIGVLTRPEDVHRQGKAVAELTNNPRTVVAEAINIRKDKSEFPVEGHLRSIRLNNEPHIITVVRDVTERHRYIKELKQQKADIEQFTYSISHDLKSPLVTIEGFSEILAENLANNDLENAQDDLRRINKAATKMHNLLTELLEYSRLGITPHTSKPTPMNSVIDDALDRVAGQIVEASAKINVDPSLPSVIGNPDRLAQVYQNLIDNSIKFRRDNSRVEIELGWDTENNCFFVDDNGCGIPLQFQNKVFTLFDQLDPEQPGTGIGLAAVKRIIDTHEGKIWVESPSPLGGTRISFSLRLSNHN